MKKIIAFIPNLLTLSNLVSGCIAIVLTLSGRLEAAFWAVIAAAVFDFFDGFAARLLGVSSPIGKELDSLADMVSFGVAPAMVTYMLLSRFGELPWLPYAAFLIPVCAALRLAKFNLDTRQGDGFLGLPSPACALFFMGLPFQALIVAGPGSWIVLPALVVLLSGLMVCELPMFALKFKSFAPAKNILRYTFIAVAGGMLILWGKGAVTPLIALYIAVCIIRALLCSAGKEKIPENRL